MCGIAGIIAPEPSETSALEAMLTALIHRGPDDGGMRVLSYGNQHVALGHRRLSIIDLSAAAHQPMANEDGSLWLSFNGEIYNFRELRRQLEAKGHVFSSHTDSEVIVHGYEEYGTGIFARLNGMFACALWDDKNRSLILARDRFGQKPLYYWQDGSRLAFASELKALLRYPAIRPELDPMSLSRYLLFEYVPAPHCLIQDVRKLEAGSYLIFKDSRLTIRPYWDLSFGQAPAFASEREAAARLEQEFKAAVGRHLESDVPLGVFLSGGIDSSAIVALMSELRPAESIKTFSIGFKEASFDETSYARQVAEHFGTEHHEQILSAGKMIEILPEIWQLMDEPLADASIIPTYLLAKFTREHVTVALGGDGGDELFCGYDPFVAHKLARAVDWLPGWAPEKIFAPLANLLPASEKNMSFDFRLKQTIKGLPYPLPIRNQIWLGSFSLEEQKALLQHDIWRAAGAAEPYAEIIATDQNGAYRDRQDELIYLYCKYYLAGDILTKVDRASMACSLEVRAPFLDAELADFVNDLPSGLKMKGLRRKHLLKRSLENKLPPEILSRKKKGFGIPLTKWLKEDLRDLLGDVLAAGSLRDHGFFDAGTIQRLIDDHQRGRRDNRKQLWTLLVLAMWLESIKREGLA